MLRQMLQAKIHRATITEADLTYEGSITIDKDLLDTVGIKEFERVEIYNINNGERFDTYAINGPRGSGVIGLNGAAARKGMVGDLLIIVAFSFYDSSDLETYSPRIILLGDDNKIKENLSK